VYDVCAAPFGNGYFVSWRVGEVAVRLNVLGLLVILTGLFAGGVALFNEYRFHLMFYPERFLWAAGITVGVLVASLWLARSSVALGLANLDALLLHTPVAAGFYERFLRPITYYRIDLALMYEEAVHSAVLQVIDELTDVQQLPRLSEAERKPVMRDFYKR
jgi:hypothetical protein